jgi:hypothetical protein
VSCNGGRDSSGGRVASAERQAARIVHLPTGDSVEIQASGPVVVPNKPIGLIVEYHPFFDIGDTARVYAVALALFGTIEPGLTHNPPWVVLKAVDRSAAERRGVHMVRSFGVVLQHGADSLWYRLHDAAEIPGR